MPRARVLSIRSASVDKLAPGKLFDGRFVLERPLGRGGHATVWLARQGELRVALKVLHPSIENDRILRERFEREGATLVQLQHPAIVRLLERSAVGEHAYFVLEYVEGVNLAAELGARAERSDYLDRSSFLSWARDIAAALDHAHGRGVIHRDVKPQNLLISAAGKVRVADFGIARVIDSDVVDATTLGRTVGSLMYMAPEQVRGEPVDRTADVFALATVLFELLTLRRAWAVDGTGRRALAFAGSLAAGPNAPQSIYHRIMNEAPPRATEERPGLPPGVDAVLARGMARAASERHPSAGALVAELARALESPGFEALDRTAMKATAPVAVAATQVTPRATAAARPRLVRRRVVVAVGALVFLASVAGSTALLTVETNRQLASSSALPPEPAREVEVRAQPADAGERVASSTIVLAQPVEDPPRRPVDAGPRGRKVTAESPASEAVPAPSRWRVRLSQIVERPGDPELVAELSADLTRAARELPDADRRTRVERLCKAADLTGEVALLARAIDELEGARGSSR